MCRTHQGLDSPGAGHSGRGTGAFQPRSLHKTTGRVGGDAHRLRSRAGEPYPWAGAEAPREGPVAVGARPGQPPLPPQQPPASGSALRCAAGDRPLLPGLGLRAAENVAGLWFPQPTPPGPLCCIRPSAQPGSRPQPLGPALESGLRPFLCPPQPKAPSGLGQQQPHPHPPPLRAGHERGDRARTSPPEHLPPGTKSPPRPGPIWSAMWLPHPASSASPTLREEEGGGRDRERRN